MKECALHLTAQHTWQPQSHRISVVDWEDFHLRLWKDVINLSRQNWARGTNDLAQKKVTSCIPPAGQSSAIIVCAVQRQQVL